MTVARHQAEAPSSQPDTQGHDGTALTHHTENDTGRARHDLVPVLAFLRLEIDQSAIVLGDLAKRLSKALCALASTDDQTHYQSNLADAAIALQSEDRIQQRLCDLAAVLAVLERAVAKGLPNPGANLDQTIIDSLLLEETRHAFAAAAGLATSFQQPPGQAEAPPVGDIDLF